MSLFFTAVKLTGVAVPTVIGSLQPALVMVAARLLLGERLARGDVLWTVVAIAGVVVIAFGGGTPDHDQLLGDLLAIASLLAWSGHFIAAKAVQPRIEALDYTAGVTLVAAAGTTAYLLGVPPVAGRGERGDWLVDRPAVGRAEHRPPADERRPGTPRRVDLLVIASANPIVAAVGAYLFLSQSRHLGPGHRRRGRARGDHRRGGTPRASRITTSGFWK